MKKIYALLCSILFITVFSLVLNSCSQKSDQESVSEENDKYDGADKALEFEIERTRDLTTGKVHWGKLWDAIQQT